MALRCRIKSLWPPARIAGAPVRNIHLFVTEEAGYLGGKPADLSISFSEATGSNK
jgi:hypothetical protein